MTIILIFLILSGYIALFCLLQWKVEKGMNKMRRRMARKIVSRRKERNHDR
jgi:hypothetical protein